MNPEQSQIFSSCTPLIDSGPAIISVSVDQSVGGPNPGVPHPNLLVECTGPKAVHLQVNGPQFKLPEGDVAGVYPAAGSSDSPDEFLPHIALSRRTLPWERNGPNGSKPWLALLLVKNSELNQPKQGGASVVSGTVASINSRDPAGYTAIASLMADSTKVDLLYLTDSLFAAIRPAPAELPLLCILKRSNKGKGDVDSAIVISNRLPDAGPEDTLPESHTAFLVSLENRSDAYIRISGPYGETALIVLHSWSFKPSKGGDFEQVVRSIGIRPNGGVLRFGNLPADVVAPALAPISGGFEALLDADGLFVNGVLHTQATQATYRGPLRPLQTDPRSDGFAVRTAPEEFTDSPGGQQDYSHAAAFEVGRLLALANTDVLQDLRDIYGTVDPMTPLTPKIWVNKLPVALQKPEWVVDPAFLIEEPWSFQVDGVSNKIFKNTKEFIGAIPGDIGGINQQLAQFGSVSTVLSGLQTPAVIIASNIDILSIDVLLLEKNFSITINNAP